MILVRALVPLEGDEEPCRPKWCKRLCLKSTKKFDATDAWQLSAYVLTLALTISCLFVSFNLLKSYLGTRLIRRKVAETWRKANDFSEVAFSHRPLWSDRTIVVNDSALTQYASSFHYYYVVFVRQKRNSLLLITNQCECCITR